MHGAKAWSWSSTPSSSLPHTLSFYVHPTVKTKYILFVTDSNGCTDYDTLIVNVNQYAYAGKDTVICLGDSIQIGCCASSLPSGYHYLWRPDSGLSDTTACRPWAKPKETNMYTLYVLDGSGNIVEKSSMTLYVDSIPQTEFIVSPDIVQSATRMCFENATVPTSPFTTFTWDFGDSSTSNDTNHFAMPCHRFPVISKDTFYWVTLTVHNACGDSTIIDSVFIGAHGVILRPETIKHNPFVVNTITPIENKDLRISSSGTVMVPRLLNNVPNPYTHKTRINYLVPDNYDKAWLLVQDAFGKTVRIMEVPQGSTAMDFDCSTCSAGIYYYSLYVDNVRIGVQKMVVVR